MTGQTAPVASVRFRSLLFAFVFGCLVGAAALYGIFLHRGKTHPDSADQNSLGMFFWNKGVNPNVDLDVAVGAMTMSGEGPDLEGMTEERLRQQVGFVTPLEKIRWNFPFCYPHREPDPRPPADAVAPPPGPWPPPPTDGNQWVQLRNSELLAGLRGGRVVKVLRCASD